MPMEIRILIDKLICVSLLQLESTYFYLFDTVEVFTTRIFAGQTVDFVLPWLLTKAYHTLGKCGYDFLPERRVVVLQWTARDIVV